MAPQTDGEIVRAIASGSREAEAELCRRFAPRIRLYGLRHLKTEDRAADLVQSVLVAVLEAVRASRVENPDLVDRFVLGTCRNVATRVRTVERRTRPTEANELDVMSVMPRFESIDESALLRCMSVLDHRARDVVYMSFHDERSAEDIATSLGTTAGNVRVVRHRAIAQLRACLDHGEARS